MVHTTANEDEQVLERTADDDRRINQDPVGGPNDPVAALSSTLGPRRSLLKMAPLSRNARSEPRNNSTRHVTKNDEEDADVIEDLIATEQKTKQRRTRRCERLYKDT